MKIQPLVSVIIPIYNVEPYIHQCVDSIINQSYKNLEIILVDDESPDNCGKICDEYAASDSRVKVIHKKNGGVGNARNSGLDIANEEYIMFLDGDDWLAPKTIQTCVESALSTDADVVFFSYNKAFGNRTVRCHVFDDSFTCEGKELKDKVYRRLYGPIGDELSSPAEVDAIVSVCMQLYRKSLIGDIRFYDNRKIGSAEDCLFLMDVLYSCRRFVYVDEPFYFYRKTNTGSLTTKYRPDLFEKWNHLYDLMMQRIVDYGLGDEYRCALNNRIAICMTGIGFNETASGSFSKSSKRLKEILSNMRYEEAFNQLDFSYFPVHWRVFYTLCRKKSCRTLMVMLNVMNWLRKYVSR